MRIALVTLLLALSGENPQLTVSPRFVFAGGAMHVICRVPAHAENRWVEVGVENWSSTGRAIDGEKGPITFDLPVLEHAPCYAGPAFCIVTRSDGKTRRAEVPVQVRGCDDSSDDTTQP